MPSGRSQPGCSMSPLMSSSLSQPLSRTRPHRAPSRLKASGFKDAPLMTKARSSWTSGRTLLRSSSFQSASSAGSRRPSQSPTSPSRLLSRQSTSTLTGRSCSAPSTWPTRAPAQRGSSLESLSSSMEATEEDAPHPSVV